MSRYPIEPPQITWNTSAFAVFATCCNIASGVNPYLWKNFDDSDIYNNLGLLQYAPAYQIIDFIGNNYPDLTIYDGLCQVKFFESNNFPWQVGSAFDFNSFYEFTIGCTTNWSSEIAHFLEQCNYCNASQASDYGFMYSALADTLYNQYLNDNPYNYSRLEWIARNGTLSGIETENNIKILFAYSRGVVYKKTPIWLYFKHYGWR